MTVVSKCFKFTLLECVCLCNEYRMKLDECLIKQRYVCFSNKYKENILSKQTQL